MESQVRLQGLEITLKVLLPALEGFALLLSKLLDAPRGGWEAEESSSVMEVESQNCLALCSRSHKEEQSAFCSGTVAA